MGFGSFFNKHKTQEPSQREEPVVEGLSKPVDPLINQEPPFDLNENATDGLTKNEPIEPDQPPAFLTKVEGKPERPESVKEESSATLDEKKPTQATDRVKPVTTDNQKTARRFFDFMKPKKQTHLSIEEVEAQLKTRHRLIGVCVVLLSIVVFAPMILDEETSYESRQDVVRIPDVPHQSTLVISKEKPTEPLLNTEARKKVVSSQKESPKVVAKQPQEKLTVKLLPTQVKGEEAGFYVQVLATSKEKKAQAQVAKIKALKMPAYAKKINHKSGQLWAVRVGIFKDNKEAQQTKANLILNGFNQAIILKQ